MTARSAPLQRAGGPGARRNPHATAHSALEVDPGEPEFLVCFDVLLGGLHLHLLCEQQLVDADQHAVVELQSLLHDGLLQRKQGSAIVVDRFVRGLHAQPRIAGLAARVDRLTPRDKDVLQTAAVVGKEFAEPVLRAVTGLGESELRAALDDLAEAELVFELAAYPVREYRFKHPLTQEVAYGMQLAGRRAELHAAVARALDSAGSDAPAERTLLIAYHWEAAGAAWEAALS